MSTLKIMGPKGHEKKTWDPQAALDEQNPQAIAILEEARKVCENYVHQGRPLFRTDPDDPAKAVQIDRFDPRATEITVGLPLAGG